jgi:anaerobic dimethyl sulfoxide reductase subunit B (iron-sulfur subunit)
LELDIEKCSACGACAIACMDQNDIDVEAGVGALRRIYDVEQLGPAAYMSISCMHCDEAPCIASCPSGCIGKDPETDLTVYDHANCIGCHSCALACPYGAPSFDVDGRMIKCDGCLERLRNGYEPACVRTCPTGAIRLRDLDAKASETGLDAS